MRTVLITGASGQLGKCFAKLAKQNSGLKFFFKSSAELDITDKQALFRLFSSEKIDYCINCAAYTSVEKAESEKEKAFKVNAEAARSLAEICKEFDSVLIHFSTDYVFDGQSSDPYTEDDETNPLNIYGASKLKGEKYIQKFCDKYFIFRTSWLYSEFGHNFYNTILRKVSEKATLNITTSQTGTPTNATDLGELVLQIIAKNTNNFGVYHYSNAGEATWYDFAKAILEISEMQDEVVLNKSNDFKTIAARPDYSVLDKKKVIESFDVPVLHWRDSLGKLITETYQKK